MKRFPNKTHYSRHFSRKELDCPCGCVTPKHVRRNLRRLALGLEAMSRRLGRLQGRKRVPLKILSGYRCVAYNKKIHGAVRSQHLRGKAADLGVPEGKQGLYLRAALGVRVFRHGGIGVYPNGGLHVDRRGVVARWSSYKGQ